VPGITETVRISKEASSLWREIGAFGAIGTWHPMLAGLQVEHDRPGALRTAHGKDRSTQVERLLEMSTDHRTYRYEMVSTPMPVANYRAEFEIEDIGADTSRIAWRAKFDVISGDEAEAVEGVRFFLRAGLEALASRYGRASTARLVGINHVALEVGDLDAALVFYQRLFEFELQGRHEGMLSSTWAITFWRSPKDGCTSRTVSGTLGWS
jgi:hypothetical protein